MALWNHRPLTQGGFMKAIDKIIGITSSSFILCLSLSGPIQANEDLKPDTCADRKGFQSNLMKCDEDTRQGIGTVKGEVLYMDGNMFHVQRFDGKEVNLHVDATTQMNGLIGRGDRIEAKVREADDQKHVLSIHKIE
jgi:translation initiation factor IF-1